MGIPRLHILTFVNWTSITNWESGVCSCIQERNTEGKWNEGERTEEHLCQCWWPFPGWFFPPLKLCLQELDRLDVLTCKNHHHVNIAPIDLNTYLSAHDSNSQHLWTQSWKIWMPLVTDITQHLFVSCTGGDVYSWCSCDWVKGNTEKVCLKTLQQPLWHDWRLVSL